MGVNDGSISDILHDAVGNVQEIIRSELRLAKTEFREEAGEGQVRGRTVGRRGSFRPVRQLLPATCYRLCSVHGYPGLGGVTRCGRRSLGFRGCNGEYRNKAFQAGTY